MDICVNQVSITVDALVATNLHANMLLSWHDLRRLGVIPHNFPATCSEFTDHGDPNARAFSSKQNNPIAEIEALISEFSDVFDETHVSPISGPPMKILLRRDDPAYRPIRVSAPRRVPLHFQDEATKDLAWFLKSGVIVPVPEGEHTEWCSPGFFVPKPNGKVRLVVDYRVINKFIDRPVHPFPSPRDVVKGILPDSKLFMKLDAVQGYYQVPLDEESSKYTTFLLPSGRFRFTRAPMGMNSSSDGFCMRTDMIFSRVPKVQKIVDDALLQAATAQELTNSFRIACLAARKNNLTLSKPKLKYGDTIDYAGYIVSSKGVFPDPARLSAVSKFPAPTDITTLRGFLGLANQLGHFVPDLAHMTNVLRLLLKKNTSWIWLHEHQSAFEKVKRLLTSPMVVKPFDPAMRTELLTDASRLFGLGYALVQWGSDNCIRLIQCGSRTLNSAETRYATIELECLAIMWAVLDCRHYLLGCHFKLVTDHRPLVGVFERPLAEMENQRLLRFRLKLTDYRMSVVWTPGKTHLIADALSRAPVFQTAELDQPAITNSAEVLDPQLRLIFDAARADECYQAVVDALLRDTQAENLPPAHPANAYKSIWQRLSLRYDSLLVFDAGRIVIPAAVRQQILALLHHSHPGIVRMQQLARGLYYWPGMSNDIKGVVDRCEPCQLIRPSLPQTTFRAHEPAEFPMHKVSMDLYSCKGKEFLVMVDRFSGYTWVASLRHETTAAVVSQLHCWFRQFGFPEQLFSDNGPCFRSVDFDTWCQRYHIINDTSSPYHPRSNGLAENAVKSTKHLLLKCDTADDFMTRLSEQHNVPAAGMSHSPSELFFGRKLRGLLPRLNPPRVIRAADPVKVPRFMQGDKVRLQNVITGLWDQEGVVSEIRPSGDSYLIRRDRGADLVRNQRFLKKLPPRDHLMPNRLQPDFPGALSPISGPPSSPLLDPGTVQHSVPRRSPRLNVVLVPELEPLLPCPRDSSLQARHRLRLLPPPHIQVPVGAATQDVSVSRYHDGQAGGGARLLQRHAPAGGACSDDGGVRNRKHYFCAFRGSDLPVRAHLLPLLQASGASSAALPDRPGYPQRRQTGQHRRLDGLSAGSVDAASAGPRCPPCAAGDFTDARAVTPARPRVPVSSPPPPRSPRAGASAASGPFSSPPRASPHAAWRPLPGAHSFVGHADVADTLPHSLISGGDPSSPSPYSSSASPSSPSLPPPPPSYAAVLLRGLARPRPAIGGCLECLQTFPPASNTSPCPPTRRSGSSSGSASPLPQPHRHRHRHPHPRLCSGSNQDGGQAFSVLLSSSVSSSALLDTASTRPQLQRR